MHLIELVYQVVIQNIVIPLRVYQDMPKGMFGRCGFTLSNVYFHVGNYIVDPFDVT